MRYGKIVLWGIFLASLAGSATANNSSPAPLSWQSNNHVKPIQEDASVRQRARQDIQQWLRGQKEALLSFSQYEVHASVRHVVTAGSGTREASVKMIFSGEPMRPPNAPEVLEFVLNGDSLDTSGRRRIQQGLTSLMSPEIGPLLYGFIPPVLAFERMRPTGGPTPETVQGEELIRYTFVAENEPGRPNGPGVRDGRPPPPPRPRDNRPPPRQQDGIRPGFNPRGLPGGEPPLERVSLWFDASGERLVMSLTELKLPGNRTLVVETNFERFEGIDLPTWRTIKGNFSMQRRLRVVTAKLEHETMYTDYSFTRD